MRTPREILLRQHQAATPRLDEIRVSIVANVCEGCGRSPMVTNHRTDLRGFSFSLRWHLAGLGAAWLVILVLNLNVGHSMALASVIPAAKIPPPQIILASLRENRRELMQLIQPAESREVRPGKLFLVQPRSERRDEALTA